MPPSSALLQISTYTYNTASTTAYATDATVTVLLHIFGRGGRAYKMEKLHHAIKAWGPG